jgi:hypothetical protein
MMLRRRHYFEWRAPERWKAMLPYQRAERFLALVLGTHSLDKQVNSFLEAINRGEGLSDISPLSAKLAIRVYDVPKGTIRSYRLFDRSDFSLDLLNIGNPRFLEYMPSALVLSYNSPVGSNAELEINLDVYEMLFRLNEGYSPSLEEREGFYRTLAVFKNILLSAPYQEVMLTETGHEFYQVSRGADGIISFVRVEELKAQ